MITRNLIGIKTLDSIIDLVNKSIPISTAIRATQVDQHIHHRVAWDIVKADIEGNKQATRPDWLKPEPIVQSSPPNWQLKNGLKGKWINTDIGE